MSKRQGQKAMRFSDDRLGAQSAPVPTPFPGSYGAVEPEADGSCAASTPEMFAGRYFIVALLVYAVASFLRSTPTSERPI